MVPRVDLEAPLLALVGIALQHDAHRLFGTLVGLTSLVLMVWVLRQDRRGWVKAWAVGVFLLVFPWMDHWQLNYFALLTPASYREASWYEWWRHIWTSGYFRGAVSGIGLVNVYVSLTAVFQLRRFAPHDADAED